MSALENSGRLPASAYEGATMYTTLSPCDMCTGACILYKVKRVVIGENKNFMGGEELLLNKGKEVVVLNNAECKELMSNFMKEKPELWYVVFGVWSIAMRKAALGLLAVASRIFGRLKIINTNCSVCYTGTRISLSNFIRPADIIALNTPRIENIHAQGCVSRSNVVFRSESGKKPTGFKIQEADTYTVKRWISSKKNLRFSGSTNGVTPALRDN